MDDKSLVDDLADVLARVVVGWVATTGIDLAAHPDVVRVMSRYRDSKVERHVFEPVNKYRQSGCAVCGKDRYDPIHKDRPPNGH